MKKMIEKGLNAASEAAKSRAARQTVMLSSSQAIFAILGFAIVIFNSHALGPLDYGILTFIITLLSVLAPFFDFGIFPAGARLLAKSDSEGYDRKLLGAMILATIPIALAMTGTVWFISLFVDSIFKTGIKAILFRVGIAAFVVPFANMIQRVCQGTNKIGKLSFYNIASGLWWLTGIILLASASALTITRSVILCLTGMAFATLMILISVKPHFFDFTKSMKELLSETKSYGFHMYSGRIVDLSAYQLNGLMISFFAGTTQAGFYSVAMSLSAPLFLVSNSLATSLFKDFSRQKRISKNVTKANIAWLLAACAVLIVARNSIIKILFSEEYISSAAILVPLALAAFFQGLYQPYNMFLSAHGEGLVLRKLAVIMGSVNVIAGLALTPVWGAMGAGIAVLMSTATYYAISKKEYERKYENKYESRERSI